MKLVLLFLLVLSTAVAAFPSIWARHEDRHDKPEPKVRQFFEAVSRHIEIIRSAPSRPTAPRCDLSKATMPTSPSPLPSPGAGLSVVHVAIGRGTQNYTCADSTSASVPVAVGAVASLYNATCTAADYPDILKMLPGLALSFNTPSGANPLMPSNIDLSGHHFFVDNTTPTFDMNTQRHGYGLIFGAKNASTPAPADAIKGQNGKGFGAVTWLKLTSKAGSIGYQEVYRLNTAGGSPPANCQGIASKFQIQYAAEYWFLN